MKLCATCRTPLVRKKYADGQAETVAQFAARRYCDRVCVDLVRRPRQPDSHPWKRAGEAVAQRRRAANG